MKSDEWYFDSGATSHMTNNKILMSNINEVADFITAANNCKMKVSAEGQCEVKANCDGQENPIDVKNVLFIPELCCQSVPLLIKEIWSFLERKNVKSSTVMEN